MDSLKLFLVILFFWSAGPVSGHMISRLEAMTCLLYTSVLGVAAGARKGGLTDKLISAYALLTASIPAFWLALVLLMIFAVWLKVLPIGLSVPIGMEASAVTLGDRLVPGILPVAALSITGISNIALHTREKMCIRDRYGAD